MLLKANSGNKMLIFDNMAVYINRKMMMDYSVHKGFFFNLNVPKISSTFRLISIQLIFIYEVNWEMAKTQLEWITPAAAPLQISYGVVAVSMEYQNKNKKIGDGYVIAATFKLHTKSTYLILILIFYISQNIKE